MAPSNLFLPTERMSFISLVWLVNDTLVRLCKNQCVLCVKLRGMIPLQLNWFVLLDGHVTYQSSKNTGSYQLFFLSLPAIPVK